MKPIATSLALLACVPLALAPAQAEVERSRPVAPALPAPIPVARDIAYPGTMTLAIDATDVARGLFTVTQTIPVPPEARASGDFILLQPKWLPGNHSPEGTIPLLADIHFLADGKPVEWRRDTVAVNAFHLALPAGTASVTARFVHTSPLRADQGRIVMTPEMLNLQWDKTSLYPAGYYVRRVMVEPTVKVPAGWTVFSALDGMSRTGATVTWPPIDYETLVDSPIYAGAYAQSWELGHAVRLDALADKAANLALAPRGLEAYRNLADEALATFGARHFDHYDFLLALTGQMGAIGLEHHRSSENSSGQTVWTEWDKMGWDRNVVPHEFVHSWNGKFRRPADLWTPDYEQPMQDTLLWVYEGQTQFWGLVLAARSGVQTTDVVLGMLASYAGNFAAGEPGRDWRSVEDTTLAPVINERAPLPYASITRNEDYYTEGALVWLEADQIIRKGTGGARGLDDFARAFFGTHDGDWGELTYTFDDVTTALNQVFAYDWASFLRTRIYAQGQPAPLNGITMGGYRLAWKDTPNPYTKGVSEARKEVNLTYSLGTLIDGSAGHEGEVKATLWGSPAFAAGIVPGTQIVAIDRKPYAEDTMLAAITAATAGRGPMQLLIKRGGNFVTVPVDYHGGLRWPWLEREGRDQTSLDGLLAPRRAAR